MTSVSMIEIAIGRKDDVVWVVCIENTSYRLQADC